MAATLTAGVTSKMLSGEVSTERDAIPTLQVRKLKLIQSKLQQQQQNQERYKVVFSDGIDSQEGMLSTAMNTLVNQGIIQIGSILRLTRFVVNVIPNRRIVIVMEMEIIAEKCDIIGNYAAQTAVDPPVQSPVHHQQQQQRVQGGVDQQQQEARRSEFNGGGRQINDSATGRFSLGNSPQPQAGQRQAAYSTYQETSPSTRSYASSNVSYREDTRQEQPRAPQASYSRPPVQSNYQAQPPPPMYNKNRGPVARNEAPARIIPIAALNPYQGRWTIKVRVTSKGELRRFTGPRGEGKVFSFDLLDAEEGEIRVTCFNEVVDQFFDMIVVGNVYMITRGNLKPARKEYNHLPNDYEIHLDNASTITQCYEDNGSIPKNKFHFRPICDIETMESNSITDLIGVVSSVTPTLDIMKKNGSETKKRAFQLKDMSGRSVEVTMWGGFCNSEGQRLQSLCDSGVFPVLAVKAGRISEFNGKQVSTIASSQFFIEPDFPEARELREWYDREGRNAPFISLSREFSGSGRQDVRKVITQIKDEKLGTSEKPDWITVSAIISFMKVENFCYTSCPVMIGDRPCSKKVTNNGDGTWRCERCDRCVDECDYRYILQLQLQDHTGVTWATAFQEAGEEIMGMPAKDLYYVKEVDQDEAKFVDIISKAAFNKFVFKLKIKEEIYGDEARVKATIVKAEKLNYSSDTSFLLEAINKLRTEDVNTMPLHPESSNYVQPHRDLGLPAANQATQNGVIGCFACGRHGHVVHNCPTLMSESQGQYKSNPQGQYTSNPQGQYTNNSQGQYTSNPQGQYTNNPQGQYTNNPQGQFTSNPQGQFTSNAYGSTPGTAGRYPGGGGGMPRQNVGSY